jgi:hypothetical protein
VRQIHIDRLRQIQKQIKKNPEHFSMSTFFYNPPDRRYSPIESLGILVPDMTACGTTACIAGWAIVNTGLKIRTDDCFKLGKEALGLTERQAYLLFFEQYWPMKFKKLDTSSDKKQAANAVARIEHFIKYRR